jgi:hypothetical protein
MTAPARQMLAASLYTPDFSHDFPEDDLDFNSPIGNTEKDDYLISTIANKLRYSELFESFNYYDFGQTLIVGSHILSTRRLGLTPHDRSLTFGSEFKNHLSYEKSQTHASSWIGPLSHIIQEVGRVPDGWAGENTKGPSSSILRDFVSLEASLPAKVSPPQVEIDPDEGYVSLRWFDASHKNSITVTFFGNFKLIVTFSSLEGRDKPARELNIGITRDLHELSFIMSEDDFERVLLTDAMR